MIWGCMPFQGYREMIIMTSIINVHIYIEILNNSFNSINRKVIKEEESFFSVNAYNINDMVSEQCESKSNRKFKLDF